jgi:hypothetical protein
MKFIVDNGEARSCTILAMNTFLEVVRLLEPLVFLRMVSFTAFCISVKELHTKNTRIQLIYFAHHNYDTV